MPDVHSPRLRQRIQPEQFTPNQQGNRVRVGTIGSYVLLILLALLFIAPIAFMFVASLKPDELVLSQAGTIQGFIPIPASTQNYQDVFDRVNFGQFFINSLLITSSIVLMGLLVNSMAGYAFARLRWRGRNLLLLVVLALMFIPFEAIAVPLFFQVTLWGWRNT